MEQVETRKTLKEVSKELGIGLSRAGRIKKKIEHEKYPNLSPSAIWGKGINKHYNLKQFKKYCQKKNYYIKDITCNYEAKFIDRWGENVETLKKARKFTTEMRAREVIEENDWGFWADVISYTEIN